MALQSVLTSILFFGKKTPRAAKPRPNIATQIIKNKRVNTRVSTTISRGPTTVRVNRTRGVTRVTGTTRVGRARISFGF